MLVVPVGATLLVALIELRGGRVLALPKGHVERDESDAQAAVRETREETGLRGAIVQPLPQISYTFYSRWQRARVSKTVSFFLLAYRSGSITHHDHEVDGVRLARPAEAMRLLSFDGERSVMADAMGPIGRWAPGRPTFA